MKRIAVDIDGTLCEEGPACDRAYAKPVEKVAELVRRAHHNGEMVVLYTARPWSDYRMTLDWLIKHSIPCTMLLCAKFNYDIILDDRSTTRVEDVEKFLGYST